MSANPATPRVTENPGPMIRASKSNLALAFVALPPERRRDMGIFYRFCRAVDDLADEPGMTSAERYAGLSRWKACLLEPQPGEARLAADVRALIAKYGLPEAHFRELIVGCEMDVERTTYERWEDLRVYCHRVASVVGLVSIEIFGCRASAAKNYATELGLALQLTNIIRDVGEDFSRDQRVYLPREDLAACGYDLARLGAGLRDEAFLRLMRLEAGRACAFFQSARAALPEGDRRALVAAEIMREIYRRLLRKMERDGFRVFDRRYRLSRWEKLTCILRGRLGWT